MNSPGQKTPIIPTRTPLNRKRWLLAIKAVVTLLLCAVILWQTDFTRLLHTIENPNLGLLLLVVVMMFLSVPLSAYKWKQTLLIHGIDQRFNDLHRWYYVAVFFNNFLPTNIGGDGYRIIKTLDNGVSRAGAVVAVFIERLSGLLVLLALGYMAATWRLTLPGAHPLSNKAVPLGGAVAIVGLLALLLMTRTRVIERLAPKLPRKIQNVLALFDDFKRHPGRTAWSCLGVSVIFHAHTITFYWLLLTALDEPPQLSGLVIMLAATAVIGMLPITINGIGLVDGMFIYAARHYDIEYEVALSAMLLIRGITILISLVGAWFYFSAGTSAHKIRQALHTPPPTNA
ncbi:MAG: flippase-like domain-containing protein [Phycisphaeraceae bacterium]|nr:flippase-like domain-containing protein [Phycisphaeraceae bacterium]